MITESKALEVLEEELPEIKYEVDKFHGNVYKAFQLFASYTKKYAETGNIRKLKSCFILADKFLKRGNNAVKTVTQNVYINSVSSLIELLSPFQKQVRKLLPESLKKACQSHLADLYYHNDSRAEDCLFENDIIEFQNM